MQSEQNKSNTSGKRWLALVFIVLAAGLGFLAVACVGPQGTPGPQGLQGVPGIQGQPGAQGSAGPAGPLAQGVSRQLISSISVSKPANGTNFVAGEQPVLSITLKDQSDTAFDRAKDFSQLRLMASGPSESLDTTTPVKLLKTSADRSQAIHHFVDLITNPDVQVNGTVLTYKLGAVSDEKPGTYTAYVWAILKNDPLVGQGGAVADFQVGAASVEKPIVDGDKCASCHLGANNGKFYFHHIDQGAPTGANWALDNTEPIKNCKTCHNNEGYAATLAADGTTRNVPSPIVKKIHGIHFGEELTNPLNTNPQTGLFKDYLGVIFPANAKNCTACHADDRWKTKPSRLACGTCHDSTWFGDSASTPQGLEAHEGGPQTDDSACAGCHTPDTAGVEPIAEAHKVSQPLNQIDVSLTPPGNGKFYVSGEKPVITLVIKNDKGSPIDHTKVDNSNFSTAALFVYGPRAVALPVLTTTALNGISNLSAAVTNSIAASGSTVKGWTFTAGDKFKIALNGNPPVELAAPVGLQTPDQVRDWLRANLKDVTVTSNATAGTVTIRSNILGANSRIEIYNSQVTTIMGWKRPGLDLIEHGQVVGKTSGDTAEPRVIVAALTTPSNDLRSDPSAKRNASNITYQLNDIAGLKPGTYMIYTYVLPIAERVPDFNLKTGIGFMTFQVGTETPEKKVATNCTTCHGDTIWHLDEGPIHAEPFDTDYCLACHEYSRTGTGEGYSRLGGTSTSGWAGFGAKPISARVHGVHRAAYLEHPEEIYEGNPNAFNEIIFPQDIRNCTKCHDAETTTGTWKTEPSRLACLSCHDSDSAKAHGTLMTLIPSMTDPYSVNTVESCNSCHGEGKEFAPDKVHNITNPFRPPYPREGE